MSSAKWRQFWLDLNMLIITGVSWNSSADRVTGNPVDIYPWYEFENKIANLIL